MDFAVKQVERVHKEFMSAFFVFKGKPQDWFAFFHLALLIFTQIIADNNHSTQICKKKKGRNN